MEEPALNDKITNLQNAIHFALYIADELPHSAPLDKQIVELLRRDLAFIV
jgi:hypothetical protein